ncbi:unnamed protein product [Lota lota]
MWTELNGQALLTRPQAGDSGKELQAPDVLGSHPGRCSSTWCLHNLRRHAGPGNAYAPVQLCGEAPAEGRGSWGAWQRVGLTHDLIQEENLENGPSTRG